jgi:hypothetical protein
VLVVKYEALVKKNLELETGIRNLKKDIRYLETGNNSIIDNKLI